MDESGPKDIKEPLSKGATVVLGIFSWITNLCLGATAFCGFVIGLLYVGGGPFVMHIFLCTTGYIIMMSLAVLTLNPHTGWTEGIKYSQRKYIHGAMQMIGTALAISGTVLVIRWTPYLPPWGYSMTTHGILGIAALACLCLNFLCGILNAFSSKIPSLERFIKIGHSLLGTLTILFAFISFIMGLELLLFNEVGSNGIGILGMTLAVIAMFGVVTFPMIVTLRRLCY